MEKKQQYTIEDLLKALSNPQFETDLPNNINTWNRIVNKDSFDELGLKASELEIFLKEWIKDNPYSNI